MKYTNEELILAFHVREMTSALRTAALRLAKEKAELAWKEAPPKPIDAVWSKEDSHTEELQDFERRKIIKDFDANWLSENPASKFVAQAHSMLCGVAEQIRGI